MLTGSLHTVFGWHVHVGENPNPRSLRNFPMQANGAEMLRLACCLATERGIEVCAPVHDAVLICAPLDRLDDDIAGMRAAMAEASRIVLDGFELRTDVARRPYPGSLHGRARRRDVGSRARVDRQTPAGGGLMGGAKDDPFDVEGLRIDPHDSTLVGKAARPRKVKWQRKFVRVPWAWVNRLKVSNRGVTYRLALLLLYEYWRTGGRPIQLSNAMLTGDGVTRRSKWRALLELEQFGLLKVERRPRKSPVVTLLVGPETGEVLPKS